MQFGPVPLASAEGAILAHSVALARGRLRKGRVLTAADLLCLAEAGLTRVTVARLGPGDVHEDAAARRLAEALVADPEATAIRAAPPFAGRVNLHATVSGLLGVASEAVTALNAVDPEITFACLRPFAWVREGQMVGTVKIISYGLAATRLGAATRVAKGALKVHPVRMKKAALILTQVPGQATTLVEKGRRATLARLAGLGMTLSATRIVAHRSEALAEALTQAGGEIVLILTGSATSDFHDVGPEGLRRAGGTVSRFGIPVDPGNLLFLGSLDSRPVLGLPGCARSPALNGADWILRRLVCGVAVGGAEIAAMGVGGLLKESPARPQPRDPAGGG